MIARRAPGCWALSLSLNLGLLLATGCHRPSTTSPAPPSGPAVVPVAASGDKAPGLEPVLAEGSSAIETPALRVEPAEATLRSGDWGLQLRVEAPSRHDDARRDLTGAVRWQVEPSDVVAVSDDGYVRPLRPGRARVRAVFDDAPAEGGAVVTVEDSFADANRGWDFEADIIPVLTRLGCNGGGCHGKADGQNGFHLTLFGYDPDGDYHALTRQEGGRRVAPFDPDASLVLLKGTGRVPHGGGPKLRADSDAYRTLRAWIAAGAPRERGPTHGALVNVQVEPHAVRLDEPGPQQLRVVAHYEDGHRRDVTRLAEFRVRDDTAAAVTPEGRVTLHRRAETDVIARFGTQVVSTRVATLINPDLSFDFAALPRRNFIDDELYKRLESLRVPPSPPATDPAFLRRVTLDLTGQLPTPDQQRAFANDPDPDKRIALVESLMARPEFVKFWQIKLGDLLQITSNRFGNGAAYYQTWVGQQLLNNTPWDAVVRELLTALGNPTQRDGGPVNYALDGPDPATRAEQAAQRFLGLRLRCAQCHDHPFDVWTQDDYYGFAAFFAKTRSEGAAGGMGRTLVVFDPSGQVEHLRTRRPAIPKHLTGEPVEIPEDDDPRKVLADWMTRPDNPFFARAMANWTWAQFFGKGLADPADDLSASNPPVHPELLDALARHFIASGYDLRELIRTIATSEAYGLSSAPVPGNEHDSRLFSRQIPRPLTAHQMADAIAQATDVPNRFPNRPTGTRAIDITDPATASTILDTFGRCPRTNGCSAVATPQLSLRQALLLISGDVVESKVASLNGYLASLLTLDPEPESVVENLYRRTVCRPPTDEERAFWTEELESAPSLRETAEDLFWALLNSREFAFNH